MESNMDQISSPSDLSHLSAEKLQQLDAILKSILALPIAEDTFAQIIDGRPSWQSKPSDAARQQYGEFRKAFSVQALKLNAQLVQNYQSTALGSREHSLRLLEITAASVNKLAGTTYADFHPDMDIMPETPPGGWDHLHARLQYDGFYVDYHDCYIRFEDYPFGLLDVVGYWAETQLFGGVVLFDRGHSRSEIKNAFVHPKWQSHAFQPSAQQIAHFSFLGKSEDTAHVLHVEDFLPFTREPGAHIERTWVRPGEAPVHVYKNDYDMPPPSNRRTVPGPTHCRWPILAMKPLTVDEPQSISETLFPNNK